MANGLFTLKQQLQGLIQKAWTQAPNTWAGSFPTGSLSQYLQATLPATLSGQFTIEFWYYRNTTGNSSYFTLGDANTSTGLEFYVGTGGTLNQLYTNNATLLQNTSTSPYTWTYVAITRDASNVIRMFINGYTNGTTATNSNAFSSTLRLGVEYYNGAIDSGCNGLLSNFRILNGTCLYTSTFTPPAAPLTNIANTAILTLQSSTIVDNSSNALSITNNGSVTTQQATPSANNVNYSTPSVEYLVVAGGGGGALGGGGAGGLLQGIYNVTAGSSITVTVGVGGSSGTSNGTNSVFGNITSIGGGLGGGYSAGGNGGSGGGTFTSSGPTYYQVGQGTAGQGNAGGLSTGLLSSGGGGGAGTNGLPSLSASISGNGGAGVSSAISGTLTAYAGGGGGGSNTSTGGVGGGGAGSSGSGTAATANTGGGGGGGYGSGGGSGGSGIVIISYPDTYNAPSALTGTYTASTSGSGSILFNGSSQYLTWPSGSNVAFGTGNFTVECWVYLTANPAVNFIIDFRDASHTTAPVFLWGDITSGVLYWDSNGGGSSVISASGATWNTNTWYHVAYVRNGTTGTIYQNGVSVGSGTDSTNYSVTPTTSSIGARYASTFYYFPGYISNLRIVKGTAVYTSSFTPPTSPLTAITNTNLLLNTVSGAQFADSSSTSATITATGSPTWNQLSPFATGLGYKNRVYTWTSSGTVTF